MADERVVIRLDGEDGLSGPARRGNRALQDLDATTGKLGASVAGAARQLLGLAGIAGAGFGLGKILSEGIRFNTLLEDTGTGIAAVIAAQTEYVNSSGQVASATKAFALAQQDASRIQEELKKAAIDTNASYREMVEGFQAGLAPMVQAGIKLEDTVEITQRLVQAAGAIDPRLMAQLSQEIRGVFEGDTSKNSRLNQVLKFTEEQIRELGRNGGLVDELKKRTEAFAEAGKLAGASFTGLLSNVKDFAEQALGGALQPLFVELKGVMKELQGAFRGQEMESALGTFGQVALATFRAIRESLSAVGEIGDAIAKSFGFTWTDAFKVVGGIAVEFLRYVTLGFKEVALVASTAFRAIENSIMTSLRAAVALLQKDLPGAAASLREGVTKNRDIFEGFLTKQEEVLRSTNAAFDPIIQKIAGIGLEAEKSGPKLSGWGNKGKAAAEEVDKAAAKAAERVRRLTEAFEDWAARQRDVLSTGGLAGYQKELAEIENRWRATNREVHDHVDAIARAGGLTPKLLEEAKAVGKLNDEWRKAQEGLAGEEAGRRYEAAMHSMTRITRDSIQQRLADEERAKRERIDNELQVAIVHARSEREMVAAARRANEERVALSRWRANQDSKILAESRGDWAAYAAAVTKDLVAAGASAVEGLQGGLQDAAQRAFVGANTVADGVRAGWARIHADTNTIGQDIADSMTRLWDEMGRGFSDLFFNVISGKLSSLKDVFKSFGDTVLRTITDTFAKMVQRWIASQAQIEKSPISPDVAGGGGAGGGAFGSLGAGGAGVVVGANLLSGLGGGHGTFDYVGMGASIGSIGGVWGAAIGAIVGLLAGLLKSSQGEKSVYFGGLRPSTAGSGGGIGGGLYGYDVQDLTNTGEYLDRRESNVPNAGRELLNQLLTRTGDLAGALADSFRRAAGTDDTLAHTLTTEMNAVIKTYLEQMSFKVHAGSAGDFDATIQKLLNEKIPRDILHSLFGSTSAAAAAGMTDVYGNRVGSGGLPGVEGGQIFNVDFSPDAPIPKMLAGLGFTAAKIKELVGLIDAKAPEDFVKYFSSLVGMVARFRDLKAKLGGDLTSTLAGVDAERSKRVVDVLNEGAGRLTGLAEELTMYTGDEQLRRAEQVVELGEQFRELQVQALVRIVDLAKSLGTAVDGLRTKIERAFETTAEARLRNEGVVNLAGARIAGAATEDDVARLTQEAIAAVGAVFDILIERVGRLQELAARFHGIQGGLDELLNPRAALGAGNLLERYAGVSGAISAALALEGPEARLEALGLSADEAGRFLEDLTGYIGVLNSAIADVAATTRSVLEAMDPSTREERLASASGALRSAAGAIGGTTDPAEIARLLGDAGAAARLLYEDAQHLRDAALRLVADVDAASSAIHKSLDQARESFRLKLMDPGQQQEYFEAQVNRLRAELAGATDPARIQEIVGQITGYANSLSGLVDSSNPRFREALEALVALLDQVQGEADEKLGQVRTDAQRRATGAQADMDAARNAFIAASNEASGKLQGLKTDAEEVARRFREELGPTVTAINAEIETTKGKIASLGLFLDTLKGAMEAKLIGPDGIADSIVKAGNRFVTAIDIANGVLTGQGTAAGTGNLRTSVLDVKTGMDDAAGAAVGFASELRGATSDIAAFRRELRSGGGAESRTAPAGGGSDAVFLAPSPRRAAFASRASRAGGF